MHGFNDQEGRGQSTKPTSEGVKATGINPAVLEQDVNHLSGDKLEVRLGRVG